MHFGGLFVAVVVCLGWNDTFLMSRSLSKLASYNSKNLNLHSIADLSCARTSIMGQQLPSRASCSLAMNTGTMSQHRTVWDADLRCAQQSAIRQPKLQLCYLYVVLATGLGNLKVG